MMSRTIRTTLRLNNEINRTRALAAWEELQRKGDTMKTIKERQEMAFVGMDVRLFLRMAATNFTRPKDRAVLQKLHELADQWSAGVDIMQQPLKGAKE